MIGAIFLIKKYMTHHNKTLRIYINDKKLTQIGFYLFCFERLCITDWRYTYLWFIDKCIIVL